MAPRTPLEQLLAEDDVPVDPNAPTSREVLAELDRRHDEMLAHPELLVPAEVVHAEWDAFVEELRATERASGARRRSR